MLVKLEECSQDSEDGNVFLIEFQNLKIEMKITDDFARRILLKNANRELVEQSLLQKDELVFGDLVADLRRLSHAKCISSLLGSKVKEVLQNGLKGKPSKCYSYEAQGHLARECNAAPREQSHTEVLIKVASLAEVMMSGHPLLQRN